MPSRTAASPTRTSEWGSAAAGGSTVETRLPHMRLARVDLPTLGRPMIATRGRRLCAAVGIERGPSDGAPGQVRGGRGYASGGGWTTRDDRWPRVDRLG